MSLPSTHRAITVTERGKVTVQERPLPQFNDDQVLVKVRAVSLNPTDWKHIDYLLKPGQSVRCDFAGDIVAIGSTAQSRGNWSIGDAVAGFVRGGAIADDNGAFQEYVATLPESIWRKPTNLPYEDAASMGGITLSTAVHGVDTYLTPGQSVGTDFAGDIAAVGSNVQKKNTWKVGDPVAGFIHAGLFEANNGSFQEYLVTLPEFIWKKPSDLPYEDAASMGGCALSTAVLALHGYLGVPYEPISDLQAFLVWGGSSATGLYAVKIASLAGFKVIAIASEHNWDLLKSAGASATFDYKDSHVVPKIKEWLKSQGLGSIKKAFDAIAEHGSINHIVDVVDKGGDVIMTLNPPKDLDSKGVNVRSILLLNALNPQNKDDFKQITDWNKRIPSYVEQGKLGKGLIPLKVFSGGIDEVPQALDYVRRGEQSGEKVVVTFQ
ncbi:hypothetical protein CPB86DRAFT_822001 [Serendipita vermifera]|nr:hypothetical protein CPB86DRAFT_822001 [Serendipita vermifera]